jgi:hypothetical protein
MWILLKEKIKMFQGFKSTRATWVKCPTGGTWKKKGR